MLGDDEGTLDAGSLVRIGRIQSEEGKISADLHPLCLEALSQEVEGCASNPAAKNVGANAEKRISSTALK